MFLSFNFAEPKNYSKKDSRSLKHDETCLVCRIDFNFGSFRAEWRNSRRPFDDALLLSPVSRCVQQMQNVLQLLRSSKLRTEQVLGLLQRPVQQMYKMLNTKDIMLNLTCHKKNQIKCLTISKQTHGISYLFSFLKKWCPRMLQVILWDACALKYAYFKRQNVWKSHYTDISEVIYDYLMMIKINLERTYNSNQLPTNFSTLFANFW